MITGESKPVAKGRRRPSRRRHGVDRLVDPCPGRPPSATTPRSPASNASSPKRRASQQPCPGARRPVRGLAVLHRHRGGGHHVRRLVRWPATLDAGRDEHGHRAGDRLPARARSGDPARHRPVDRGLGRATGSSSRTASRWSGCAPITAVLFDKTGTLTEGRHVVTGVAGAGDRRGRGSAARRRRRAGQRTSARPGDRRRRRANAGDVAAAIGFRAITGRGVEAVIDGRRYAVGGPALLRERSLDVPSRSQSTSTSGVGRGAAVLHLVRDDEIIGAFALEDKIRREARQAVARPARRSGIDGS